MRGSGGWSRCNKKQRDDAYRWQRSREQRKGRNVMTKEFAKMIALSLASVLLLAAAAVTSGGM